MDTPEVLLNLLTSVFTLTTVLILTQGLVYGIQNVFQPSQRRFGFLAVLFFLIVLTVLSTLVLHQYQRKNREKEMAPDLGGDGSYLHPDLDLYPASETLFPI